MATAFGETAGKIGILIAMASIIGVCLLESGAADRIVRFALGITGERGAPAARCSTDHQIVLSARVAERVQVRADACRRAVRRDVAKHQGTRPRDRETWRLGARGCGGSRRRWAR